MDSDLAEDVPARVVVLYAVVDKAFGDELVKHLKPHAPRVRVWSPDAITAGERTDQVAYQEIASAKVVVLLLSVDFLNDTASTERFEQVKKLQGDASVHVLPVQVRAMTLPEQYADLQMLPRDGKPIAAWPEEQRDDAWRQVAKEILASACAGPSLGEDKALAAGGNGTMDRWRSTHLWREFESRSRDNQAIRDAAAVLAREMTRIEALLDGHDASAQDFTLHDRDHAYRVAERMADIIPTDVLPQLSAYELVLLLLSAYLHDIGLAPGLPHVSSRFRHLLTGEPCGLTEEEIEGFQAWLDNDGRGLEPPFCKAAPTEAGLLSARELITHYCREHHERWGEQWIRKNLDQVRPAVYPQWLDDLVDLCNSHRLGYSELAKARFDPKQIGSPSQTVHLRYLAAVLRVADVLEFDPERTPDVIFRHRAMVAAPLIAWHKDQQISILHERKDNRLVVFAVLRDARAHRAVELMVDDVDLALRVCRRLADETHFCRGPGLTAPLPHRWDLPSAVHREIRPKAGAYEYIDGSFRPDTNKILALLGGTELYGKTYAAVRELLMNALDAVSEQIAYERLEEKHPSEPELEVDIGNRHLITLRVEEEPALGWTLVCSDTGAGMSKRILRDHFLVSGTSRRHDVLALERKCRDAGFMMGRVGQFGIGVLSYFMVASRVTILTRRSQLAGEGEDTGWMFETEGVGSFGELRRHGHRRGTEIRLSLREDVLRDHTPGSPRPVPLDWLAGLREYLRDTLRFVPCRVDFILGNCIEPWSLRPGWTMDLEWIKDLIVDELRPSTDGLPIRSLAPEDLLSTSDREAFEAARLEYERHWSSLHTEVRTALRLRERQGFLPDHLGRYRIVMPYFDLHHGRSMVFVHPREEGEQIIFEQFEGDRRRILSPLSESLNHRSSHTSAGMLWESWRGFAVDKPRFATPGVQLFRAGALIQIDWASQSAGSVGVTRENMRYQPKATEIRQWLWKRATTELQNLYSECEGSLYFDLSMVCIGDVPPGRSRWRPKRWFAFGRETKDWWARWGVQAYPGAFPILCTGNVPAHQGEIVLRGVRLAPIVTSWHFGSRCWGSKVVPPDRIIHLRNGPHYAALVWEREPSLETRAVVTAAFPPAWKHLACVGHLGTATFGIGVTVIWNHDHVLAQVVDRESLEWVRTVPRRPESDGLSRAPVFDPRPYRDALLQSRSRAAAWVMRCLEMNARDVWSGLVERDPGFLVEIWLMVFGDGARSSSGAWLPIVGFGLHRHEFEGLGVVSVTPESWFGDSKAKGLEGVLPEPDEDWTAEWVPLDTAEDSAEVSLVLDQPW